jgi:hypothetical protein
MTALTRSIPSAAVFLVVACGTPERACVPGMSTSCVAASGCAGIQVCNAAGTGLGACACFDGDAGTGVRSDGGPIDRDAFVLPLDAGPRSDAEPPVRIDAGLSGVCDPITSAGCGPGEGCYLDSFAPGWFVCMPAGTTPIGADIPEPRSNNSCVPGARAFGRVGSTRFYCVPWCSPVETYLGAPEGEHGRAPYRCEDVGGTALDQCRFAWIISSMDRRELDNFGLCVAPDATAWDHDMMPETASVPWPACPTLANTDTDGDGYTDHYRFRCSPGPD